MEIPVNFASVYGWKGKTPVDLVMGSKEQSWEKAAVHVNSEMKNEKLLTGENMRQRALRYRRAYFTAADSAKRTGAGVEGDGGATNFDEALMAPCYGFELMHAPFWNNPHLRPTFEAKSGYGCQFNFSSREVQYTAIDSMSGGDSDRDSVAVGLTDAGDEDDQQKEQDLEYRENSGSEYEDGHEYHDCQEDDYQEPVLTQPYQGEAFAEFRTPRRLRSEADITTSTSNKRRRSSDRSRAPNNNSNPTSSNVWHYPPAGLLNHQQLDHHLGSILTTSDPAKLVSLMAEARLKKQAVKLKHDKEIEQNKLKLAEIQLKLDQEKLKFDQEKLKHEQERLKYEQSQRVHEDIRGRRRFMTSFVTAGARGAAYDRMLADYDRSSIPLPGEDPASMSFTGSSISISVSNSSISAPITLEDDDKSISNQS
ncbi:hypothetical protein EDD21DRAFT_177956 [Dissophora ornata]|nr:hypothetical protein EDD21DRAFT_177956 [Dissophora ornata]